MTDNIQNPKILHSQNALHSAKVHISGWVTRDQLRIIKVKAEKSCEGNVSMALRLIVSEWFEREGGG